MRRLVPWAPLAALGVVSLAGSAAAQDYTAISGAVTDESIPTDVTTVTKSQHGGVSVDLPFPFTYFGRSFDRVWFSRNGYLSSRQAQGRWTSPRR